MTIQTTTLVDNSPTSIEKDRINVDFGSAKTMATLFLDLSPELEQRLLRLPPSDKLRLIQLLAQSLNDIWSSPSPESSTQLSEFFRCSPLAEVAATGELDLSRDRSVPGDRFVL